MRILVVAHRDLRGDIARSLEREGHVALAAESEASAARLLRAESPDIVVLHAHSLSTIGAQRLKRLASRAKVRVLETEPDGPGDPQAELQFLAGRVLEYAATWADATPEVQVTAAGILTIDARARTASVGDRRLDLTAKEFEILRSLALHPGWVWTREQLLEEVWGYYRGDTKVVTVHVGNLRKKLAQVSAGDLLETVRGVGYRLGAATGQVSASQGAPPGRVPAARTPGDRREGAVTVEGATESKGLRQGRQMGPFAGRERELQALSEALDATLRGRATAVALTGDAGIGKTRLAEEFASLAAERGARVCWGRCYEHVGQPPYGPWAELLRHAQPEARLTRAGVVPGHPTSLAADEVRLRLFEEFAEYVDNLAGEQPLMLILEDLHWADESSILLLDYMVQRSHAGAVLLLVTYRFAEAGRTPLLADTLAQIARAGGHIMRLHPLTRANVKTLLEEATEGPVTDRLAEAVYEQTDGNAFYVTELIRELMRRDDRATVSPDELQLARQEGVRRFILARLSQVSSGCRLWLERASVVGQEFLAMVVGAGTVRPPLEAAALLDEAERAHLILPLPGIGRYRFTHSLVREVVYGELPSGTRALLHGEIGTAVERLCPGEIDQRAAEIAYHFLEAAPAGYADKAYDYALRAARSATRQCAWSEACVWYEKALDVGGLLPAGSGNRHSSELARVHEELGDSYAWLTQAHLAEPHYARAAELIPPHMDAWKGRTHWKRSNVLVDVGHLSEADEAIRAADAALGIPGPERSDEWWEEWVSVQLEHAYSSVFVRRLDEVDDRCDAVLSAIDEHDIDVRGVAYGGALLGQLYYILFLRSCLLTRFVTDDRVRDLSRTCAQAYRSGGWPAGPTMAEIALGCADLWDPTRRGEAVEHLREGLRLAEAAGHVLHELEVLWCLGVWHRHAGEVDEVRGLAERSLELDAPLRLGKFTPYTPCARGNLAWVAWRQGHLDHAHDLAVEAVESFERAATVSPFEWIARWPLVGVALAQGDRETTARQVIAMLGPLQAAMPADLERTMRRFVETADQGTGPEQELSEELVHCARDGGYL